MLISQAQGFGPRPVCIAFDRDPSTGCSLAWRTANIRATVEEGCGIIPSIPLRSAGPSSHLRLDMRSRPIALSHRNASFPEL